MRASRVTLAICVLSATLVPGWVWAQAAGNVQWHTTLESARRQAAQSNQLVLIHFWAPWCGACRRMEQEVFTQPNVSAAISSNYVAAKINADHFQKITEQYGVTALPTDVIVTPEGQMIQKIEGMRRATEYSAQLNQVASVARPRSAAPNAYAQAPAGQNPATAMPPAGGSPAAPAVGMSDSRYADYFRQRGGEAGRGVPAATAMAAPPPAAAPAMPPYAAQHPAQAALAGPAAAAGGAVIPNPAAVPGAMAAAPPAAPAVGTGSPAANAAGMAPLASGGMPNVAAPGMTIPNAVGPTAPPSGPAMSGYANFNRPAAQPSPQPGVAAGAGPAMPTASINAPSAAAAAAAGPSVGLGSAVANSTPAAPAAAGMAAASAPAGNPPVGLDGFCPVALVEKKQWQPGDPRWGAIHRGRTYLFAGPNEQKQFLDNPDQFAPVASGIDVVIAVERRQTVPGSRVHGGFYGGKVYLFADEESLGKFSANPEHYIGALSQAVRSSGYTPYR